MERVTFLKSQVQYQIIETVPISPTRNQNDCADRVTTSVYRKTHGVLLQRSIEWWFAIWYMLQSAWGNAYEFEIFRRPYDKSSRFIRFLFPCSPSTGPFNFNWFHLQENIRGRPQAKTSIPKTLSSRVPLGQPVLAKLAKTTQISKVTGVITRSSNEFYKVPWDTNDARVSTLLLTKHSTLRQPIIWRVIQINIIDIPHPKTGV